MTPRFFIPSLIFVFLLLVSPIFAQEAKIWTDQNTYGEGDYVKINIQLPREKFSSCETHLIDPSGYEFSIGEGGCVAGITEVFDERFMTAPEERYTESGQLEVASSVISDGGEYGRLGDKFGTWGIKVLVKKDGQVWQTLTTNFEYKYYNSIVGFCRLENEKTKTCEFLGSPFTITKGEGCGPNPVEITISYFGGTHTLNIKLGDKAELTVGLITVRNMGSPCSADVLNVRFDKAIPSEETSIKASAENKKMEAKIDGETKTFSLPTEEKTQIIDARVNEENKLKKISVEIDNTKDVLVIKSNDVSAETKLPLSVEGSHLYVESKGEKVEINILPDTASEKVKTELDSVQSLEIISGSVIYLAKGLKNGKYTEVKLDGTTGQIIKEPLKTTYVILGVVILVIIGVIFVLIKRKNRT